MNERKQKIESVSRVLSSALVTVYDVSMPVLCTVSSALVTVYDVSMPMFKKGLALLGSVKGSTVYKCIFASIVIAILLAIAVGILCIIAMMLEGSQQSSAGVSVNWVSLYLLR